MSFPIKRWVSYWENVHRNSEFIHITDEQQCFPNKQWWVFPQWCKRLPEDVEPMTANTEKVSPFSGSVSHHGTRLPPGRVANFTPEWNADNEKQTQWISSCHITFNFERNAKVKCRQQLISAGGDLIAQHPASSGVCPAPSFVCWCSTSHLAKPNRTPSMESAPVGKVSRA